MADPDSFIRPMGLRRPKRWAERLDHASPDAPPQAIPPLPAEFRPRGKQPGAWPPPSGKFLPAVRRGIVPVLLFALGAGCGVVGAMQYGTAPSAAGSSSPFTPRGSGRVGPPPTVPVALQEQLDRAYQALRAGDYPSARQQFTELLAQRPDWAGLNLSYARGAIYQGDARGALVVIKKAEKEGRVSAADSYFFQGLTGLMVNDLTGAERNFPLAVAADPTSAEYYYFWGETLLRNGKPAQAAARFRCALLRNEYETAESLYTAKLWLSEILSNSEAASGDDAKIDAGLAQDNPPGAALIAGAARDIRGGLYADAAAKLRRAGLRYEASMYRVLLQDVAFRGEAWRPEFQEFYPAPVKKETPAG